MKHACVSKVMVVMEHSVVVTVDNMVEFIWEFIPWFNGGIKERWEGSGRWRD